jgi:hypothetical protein
LYFPNYVEMPLEFRASAIGWPRNSACLVAGTQQEALRKLFQVSLRVDGDGKAATLVADNSPLSKAGKPSRHGERE